MPDRLTVEQRHRCMSSVRNKNTNPELLLRKTLWRNGFRYRVNDKRLPGKPDIVLPKYRTAIFIHGCFWHGHSGCNFYRVPKTNSDFWAAKVANNQERDQIVWRQLEAKGWSVIIVWECQLKKTALNDTVMMVIEELRRNLEGYRIAMVNRKKAQEEYHRERRIRKAHEEALLNEIKQI